MALIPKSEFVRRFLAEMKAYNGSADAHDLLIANTIYDTAISSPDDFERRYIEMVGESSRETREQANEVYKASVQAYAAISNVIKVERTGLH